jgi:F-type H+-transporting ATPase subunit gamma
MRDIISHSEENGQKWFDARKDKLGRKIATLVITADKGLAGGYNHSIIRYVEESCPAGSLLMPIGNVGKRYFMDKDYILVEDFATSMKEPTVYEAKEAAAFAASQFLEGKIDEFHVVYTHMHSIVRLEPTMQTLLPLDAKAIVKEKGAIAKDAGADKLDSSTYRYLPSEEGLFDALVPQYLKGIVYGALVSAFASEQAARMTAMDAATKNAEEMLGRLGLRYNRARQAAITSEVSEIVAGAAALED